MKYFYLIAGVLILAACESKVDVTQSVTESEEVKVQRPSALDSGRFFEVEGKKMLFGGENESQHFDVSNLELVDAQFHYGIGREAFPALLEPEFISVEEADASWSDEERFLVAFKGDEVKAYAVIDLKRHEVVNDMLDGEPIMAAYCVLADLGAIYERNYGSEELTFALSGYTYFDPEVWDGLDGFVFWDRETESLWWPLIGRAVSGPLKGTQLLEMDKANWRDTTWGEVKSDFPNAQVLISGQDYERPNSWDKEVDASYIVENFK